MSGGGNEAIGGWNDSVHYGMDKLAGQQGSCRGGGQGSTNEKIRAIEIQFHMFKSWLHEIKYLLCSLFGQA